MWGHPRLGSWTEQLLEVLASADLPPDVADLGFHALTNHIQGFARQRVAYGNTQTDTEEMHDRVQELLTQRDFPRVAEHVRYHVDGHGNHDEFGYVLDLILDGLAHSNEN